MLASVLTHTHARTHTDIYTVLELWVKIYHYHNQNTMSKVSTCYVHTCTYIHACTYVRTYIHVACHSVNGPRVGSYNDHTKRITACTYILQCTYSLHCREHMLNYIIMLSTITNAITQQIHTYVCMKVINEYSCVCVSRTVEDSRV